MNTYLYKLFITFFMSGLLHSEEIPDVDTANDLPADIILINEILSEKPFFAEGFLHKIGDKIFFHTFDEDNSKKIELTYQSKEIFEKITSGARYKVVLKLSNNNKYFYNIILAEPLDELHGEVVVNSIAELIALTEIVVFEKSDMVEHYGRIKLILLSQHGFFETHYPKLFALGQARLAEMKANLKADPFEDDR